MTSSPNRWRSVVLGLVLTVAGAASAAATPAQNRRHPGKLSEKAREEATAKGSAPLDVLVRFRQAPGASERSLVKASSGKVRRQHRSRWMSVRIPGRLVEAFADNPAVEYVALDGPISLAAMDAARETVDLPGPALPESVLKGAGVTIAVVDSGVALHSEIQTLVAAVDFVAIPPDPVTQLSGPPLLVAPQDSVDPNGHGTHVAGLLVGNGSHSLDGRYVGIAPEASLLSVRVLDGAGNGQSSDLLAGLEWVLAHRNEYGVRVLNLSLGHPVYEPAANDPLVQAVDALWDAGVVVVCSAGNAGRNGHGTISSPCNSRKAITVGALNDRGTPDLSDDVVTTYSSRGPTLFDLVAKPDLIAPGNRIVSLRAAGSQLDVDYPERRIAGDPGQPDVFEHFEMSGTSMAAPIVAGTAALMVQQEPWLNPGTVKARLMLSAKKPAVGDPFATGAGVLDILAALHTGGQVVDAPSPLVHPDSVTGTLSVENTAVLWADATFSLTALWSAGVEWSAAAPDAPVLVSSSAILWGDAILWSEALLWPENVVTPDAILWTECTFWSEAILWDDAAGLSGQAILWDDAANGQAILWDDAANSQAVLWDDAANSLIILIEDPS
jgi:serine protease AprX